MINFEFDLAMLKLFLQRTWFEQYSHYIDKKTLSSEAVYIINGYTKWYEENSQGDIELVSFIPWFFNNQHADWFTKEQTHYKMVFTRISEVEEMPHEEILKGLKYRKLADKVLSAMKLDNLAKSSREVITTFDTLELEETLKKFNSEVTAKSDPDLYTWDIEESEEQLALEGIFNWRLHNLNNLIGPIHKGLCTVCVAGYNVGKSAFAISEMAHFLPQLPLDKTILYFNNEQGEPLLLRRFYAAVLRWDTDKVLANLAEAKELFAKAGGDRIKLIHAHGKSLKDIKRYCKKYNPGVILIDQADPLANGVQEHRPYYYVYSKLRELACEFAPVIAFTQAKSGGRYRDQETGVEMFSPWVGSSDMFFSNVDKQANIDTSFGIGRSGPVISHPTRTTVINFNVDKTKTNTVGKFSAVLTCAQSILED